MNNLLPTLVSQLESRVILHKEIHYFDLLVESIEVNLKTIETHLNWQ